MPVPVVVRPAKPAWATDLPTIPIRPGRGTTRPSTSAVRGIERPVWRYGRGDTARDESAPSARRGRWRGRSRAFVDTRRPSDTARAARARSPARSRRLAVRARPAGVVVLDRDRSSGSASTGHDTEVGGRGVGAGRGRRRRPRGAAEHHVDAGDDARRAAARPWSRGPPAARPAPWRSPFLLTLRPRVLGRSRPPATSSRRLRGRHVPGSRR